MTTKEQGIIHKYNVERVDGKFINWCFVLEDKDPLAVPALWSYASAARDAGYHKLADELEMMCKMLDPERHFNFEARLQGMILQDLEERTCDHEAEIKALKQKLHERGEQWKHQMRLMDQDHREKVGKLESEKAVLLFLVKEFGEAASTVGSISMITGESCWLGRDTTALIECWDRKNPHATCERLRRAYETWRKIVLKNWGFTK